MSITLAAVTLFVEIGYMDTAHGNTVTCKDVFGPKVYRRGNLLYQKIQWLPPTPFGMHEQRSIDWDFKTGSQREWIKSSISNLEVRQKLEPYVQPQSRVGVMSYGRYEIGREGNIFKFNVERKYESVQGIPTNRVQVEENDPFYNLPSPKPGPLAKVLPAVKGITAFEKSHELLTAKPSEQKYSDYPEVRLVGFVEEKRFGSQNETVELLPLGNDNVLRIQRVKSKNFEMEIFDNVTGLYHDSSRLGPLYPGIVKKLFPHIAPELHDDLVRLAQALVPGENEVYPQGSSYGKAFERLLAVNGIDSLTSFQDELLAEGKRRQRAFIQEILDFIIPLYRERRGWDEAKIKVFSENAFKTMDNSRYTVIRDDSGKIKAVLGFTSVEYGKVRFFDKKSNSIVELTGSYGAALRVRQGHEHINSDQIPVPEIWQSAVGLLPMETDGFEIPHPAVLDFVQLSQGELERRLKYDEFLRSRGYEIDLTKPIQFFTGRKIEPVKFGVEKGIADGGMANVEVLTQLLLSIFPGELNSRFNNEGQTLVTYNTLDGKRMYKRLGFSVIPGVEPKLIEGQVWYPLTATPESMRKAVENLRYMKSEEVQEALEILEFISRNGGL